MGIINRLIKKDGGKKSSIINNRCQGPKITANRRVIFKQFNYQFNYKSYESVAS